MRNNDKQYPHADTDTGAGKDTHCQENAKEVNTHTIAIASAKRTLNVADQKIIELRFSISVERLMAAIFEFLLKARP